MVVSIREEVSCMKDPILSFDDNSKDEIISSLGLKTDKNGYLSDEKGRILTDQDLEPLKKEEFGGILKGSKIAIKKDKAALIKYFIDKLDSE